MLNARRVSLAIACFSYLTTACAVTPSTSGTNEASATAAVSPCKTAKIGNVLGADMPNAIMNQTSGCITAIFEVDATGKRGDDIARNIEIAPMGRAHFTADLGSFGVEITLASGTIEVNSMSNGLVTKQGAPARSPVYNGDNRSLKDGTLSNHPWTMIQTMAADLSTPTNELPSNTNTYFVAGAAGGGGGGGSAQGRAQAVLADGTRVTQDVGASGYPQAQAPQAQQAPQDQGFQQAQQQNGYSDGSVDQYSDGTFYDDYNDGTYAIR